MITITDLPDIFVLRECVGVHNVTLQSNPSVCSNRLDDFVRSKKRQSARLR